MKKLQDFKLEINKCSKCGLCQSVCPIYEITGNDCAVSRGKFVMLDGVLKGDLKLNKNINKYLDLCLKCDKCSKFCPSNIDVCEILETAKFEYNQNSFKSKVINFLESKYVFGNFIKLMKILSSPFVCKVKEKNHNGKNIKVLFFRGCVNNIFPTSENALKQILKESNVEIIEKDFDCCGLPFLSSGNLDRFEEVKKHNLKILNCDFDYILTDCASCESTLKKYIDAKFISAGELIAKSNLKFKFKKPIKVTFHKPCHLEDDNFIEAILNNCENVEYVKMNDYDKCCGFGGEFAIKNRKISKEISTKKAENILKTGADYVITTCPGCILGLKQGLLLKKTFKEKSPKVLNLTEFLNIK